MATKTDRKLGHFDGPSEFEATSDWHWLPFRFQRLSGDEIVLTNMVGEHVILPSGEFDDFADRTLAVDSALFRVLRSRHFLRHAHEELPVELLALKLRTRLRRLRHSTSLHLFVVTLRCEHSCRYCQVSRRSGDSDKFDMSDETADRALELVFRSPSPNIKIEFQGGEPLLNFELVRRIVVRAEQINARVGKDLVFVVATNLALLDADVLAFARDHALHFSTSIDGPADLHNVNRPRLGVDSWERAVDGIRRVREELGADRVSALMTTTAASLDRAVDIVDCYVELGLQEVFLRPMSPYGFAIRTGAHDGYRTRDWIEFYREGLEHILAVNRRGYPLVERYAAILLKKMLTNDDSGYVDLRSPAGIGIGALVYNYDGSVYASDEGRMLAEMGDTTFRLGDLHHDDYADIMLSDALLDPLEQSMTVSVPMCCDCAFEPYCGAEPVFHHATFGDPVGKKPLSDFCQRQMALCELLLRKYDDDPFARRVFRRWAQ